MREIHPRYGFGAPRFARGALSASIAALIVCLIVLAALVDYPSAALAGSPLRVGVEFPRGVTAGTRVSVKVTVPSSMLSATLSLQQLERPKWKTRALQRPRRVGALTLSFLAPSTASTLLLRIDANRGRHLLWGSRYVQVPVHLPSKASSECVVGQAPSSSPCEASESPLCPAGEVGSAPSCTEPPMSSQLTESAPQIGTPPWWSGECDSGNYPGAFPLGASWHGLIACGPQPAAEGAADFTVRFFPGAWGEYEWECVELSMRWMYLAYGVHPYDADGYDIVDNYSSSDGGELVKIANGTAGQVPQPGDVIELPAEDHTAVVSAESVNLDGDGSITVIQQNAGRSGWGTYPVSEWNVAGVSDWLHKP
jgi:hypothetical protein